MLYRKLHRPCLVVAVAVAVLGLGAQCSRKPLRIAIQSPQHGDFIQAGTTLVSGQVSGVAAGDALVRVNGAAVAVQPDRSWSTPLALDAAQVFNPVVAEVAKISSGQTFRQQIAVISGDSVADGGFSIEGIALRLNDSGLDSIEPVVSTLVDPDASAMIPPGTVVVDNLCYLDSIFGCLGRVDVTISGSPPPSLGGLQLAMDSDVNFVQADVTLVDLSVRADADDATGIPFHCVFDINSQSTLINGAYSLEPSTLDPSAIDVAQLGLSTVVLGGFSDSTNCSGILGGFVELLVGLFVGDVRALMEPAFETFLNTPDAFGNTPVAAAIEQALADVSITGPAGESLGVLLEAPMFQIVEDAAGVTFGSDARITADFGTGPGQCSPPPGAPDLAASLHVSEPFPAFGAVTPVAGLPYGVGICISTSAFNQLLKADTECGLMRVDLTEMDLGFGPQPVTMALLSLFIPEFGDAETFPPDTPMVITMRPTLAPVLTGNSGPAGELAELRVGQLLVAVETEAGQVLLEAAVDFRAGLDFAFDDVSGLLVPSIGSVSPADVFVRLLENPLGVNEASVTTVLTLLLPLVLPGLGDSLGTFPMPAFLGLGLRGVEVARSGAFLSLFADLVPLTP